DPVVLLIGSSGDEMHRLAVLLRDRRIGARVAGGGMEALTIIRTHPPTAIVLQFDLPDIDGLEILRRIHRNERSRSIPLLFLAANAMEGEEALDIGASDVLSSPWRDQEAVARVCTHIELGGLRAAARRSALPRRTNALEQSISYTGSWIGVAMQAGRMYGFEW